jgi:hypothetical protein
MEYRHRSHKAGPGEVGFGEVMMMLSRRMYLQTVE